MLRAAVLRRLRRTSYRDVSQCARHTCYADWKRYLVLFTRAMRNVAVFVRVRWKAAVF